MRGAALVLVIWFITLLTALATGFAFVSRTETQLAYNHVAAAQARLLADAGIARATYEMFKPDTDAHRWRMDGRPHVWEFDGTPVRIVIRDESAKLDLNRAPEVLLNQLFKNAGLDDDAAARMTESIVDWRDTDDVKLPFGAEAEEYEAAGLDVRPPNAHFESVDELRLVMGMTPELFQKVRGVLTVYSRIFGFNGLTAPAQVLHAIPGADPQAVEEYLEQRVEAWDKDLPVMPFKPAVAYTLVNQVVSNIIAEAELPDGTAFARETSLKLANPTKPHLVLHYTWLEAERLEPAEAVKEEHEQRD